MDNNLYWAVYKNLEKELIELSYAIYIDDKQLSTYSIKIAELLIRTAVEIESISKDLYYANGGTKANDNTLAFDSDCIDYLETLWKLGSKVVKVTGLNLYLSKAENIELTPLNKANIRGKCDWKKAYQAVKHSRNANLQSGTLKNYIRALAALFLLNLYYRDTVYQVGKDAQYKSFDAGCDSDIFSIKINSGISIMSPGLIAKQVDFEQCVYIFAPTTQSGLSLQQLFVEKEKKISIEKQRLITNKLNVFVLDGTISSYREFGLLPQEKVIPLEKEALKEASQAVNAEYGERLTNAYAQLEYELILNKNQF